MSNVACREGGVPKSNLLGACEVSMSNVTCREGCPHVIFFLFLGGGGSVSMFHVACRGSPCPMSNLRNVNVTCLCC